MNVNNILRIQNMLPEVLGHILSYGTLGELAVWVDSSKTMKNKIILALYKRQILDLDGFFQALSRRLTNDDLKVRLRGIQDSLQLPRLLNLRLLKDGMSSLKARVIVDVLQNEPNPESLGQEVARPRFLENVFDLARSIAIVNSIHDEMDRNHAFRAMFRNLIEAEEFDLVIENINIISYLNYKNDTLQNVFRTLLQVGKVERAIELFNRMIKVANAAITSRGYEGFPRQSFKATCKVLEEIVEMDGGIEIINRAIELNHSIENTTMRVDLLIGIAKALVKIGDVDRAKASLATAIEVANASTNAWEKWTLEGICKTLAAIGEIDWAITVASGITNPRIQDSAFEEISEVLTKVGEVDRAVEVANLMSDAAENGDGFWIHRKSEALCNMACRLSARREIGKALQVSQAIRFWKPWFVVYLVIIVHRIIELALYVSKVFTDISTFSRNLFRRA